MSKKFSGKQVVKAGDQFLDDSIFKGDREDEFQQAMEVLSYWRFSHEKPLNDARELLHKFSLKEDKTVIIAKRLKRQVSIVNKLRRFQDVKMKLKNMQDIGGCRAIYSSEKKLIKVLKKLQKSKEFIFEGGKKKIKNYIETPKVDGYRGVHIVGRFSDGISSRNIEIQLRTRVQHYWATALEIVDLFMGQTLKSSQGDIKWEAFFIRVSEQFALIEKIHLFQNLDRKSQQEKYIESVLKNKDLQDSRDDAKWFSKELHVVKKLEAFSSSLQVLDDRLSELSFDGYVLVNIDILSLKLTTMMFDNTQLKEAEIEYLSQEKKAAKDEQSVVALISTTAVGGIKEAFPNYFADSTQFIYLLNIILESSKEQNRVPSLWKLMKDSLQKKDK